MSSMQSTDQADRTRGTSDAATFLKSIRGLKGAEWDRAVHDRIRDIEYSNGRQDVRLSLRDSAEIEELRKAIRDEENDRMERAGLFDSGDDHRDDADWHGGEEDVANWPGKTGGNWT
jgi:hypothetical protein